MFSPTVDRALAIIVLNPNVPLHVGEVQRLAGEKNYQATKNAIDGLVKRGLVSLQPRNDKDAYVPNLRSAYYPAARLAALAALPWSACLRERGINLAGISAVYVYGSQVHGNPGPASDIDVLVIGAADKNTVFAAFEPIAAMTGRKVDPWLLRSSEAADRLEAGDAYIQSALAGLRVFGEEDFA